MSDTVLSGGQQRPKTSSEGYWGAEEPPRKATEPILEPWQGQERRGLPAPPAKCQHITWGGTSIPNVGDQIPEFRSLALTAGLSCWNHCPLCYRVHQLAMPWSPLAAREAGGPTSILKGSSVFHHDLQGVGKGESQTQSKVLKQEHEGETEGRTGKATAGQLHSCPQAPMSSIYWSTLDLHQTFLSL